MKLIDKIELGFCTIGRRVQYRKNGESTTERASSNYCAVFNEPGARDKPFPLGTSSKHEARTRAIEEYERRVREGRGDGPVRRKPFTIDEMIRVYLEFCETKNLVPKTLAKYRADLAKFREFCKNKKITRADRIDERRFYEYATWLRKGESESGREYSSKSCYTALTILIQAVKHCWEYEHIPEYKLRRAKLPRATSGEQPAPTLDQVERIAAALDGHFAGAVLILAYSGMRVGELVQLRWADIVWRDGEPVKFHIRRGGSGDAPKDKESRFVPVSPRLKPVIRALPREGELVIPGLRDRALLAKVKKAAKECGIPGRMTVHAFRHTFVSTAASCGVPYRILMSWTGHASSATADLYYHAQDQVSEQTMNTLAERISKGTSR